MPSVDTAIPATGTTARVGYVCKVYPRFSETFIVTEILAHERAGLDLDIFSLRPPLEGRFHELLGEVRSPVTYLDSDQPKLGAAWTELRGAISGLPGMGAALPELIAADARDAFQAIALARAVRDRGLTHLHAHFGSVATTVARLAARLSGVPYSFTAHAKDIFHDDVDLDDLGRKIADAATVVTVSDFNVLYLEGLFGPLGSLRRIYNGLDLARFPYRDPALRLPEVVSVGRLVEKKGLTHLIDAMAILRSSHPALRCTIVGGGPLEVELRAQVTALDLEDRVVLTGPLPQAEVRRIVGGAAAFAAPCVVGGDGNRDGLPTVLLEAMALGTPCIGTDVTGIPEVLTDGVSGLVARQGDARDLATAIARLVDGPALRSDLAAQARRRIEEDFDTERQTAKLRGCFTGSVHGATPSDRTPALVP